MEWEKLLSNKTLVPREKQPSYFAKYPIGDLEKDYKAIISSAAFRRLQDKTQVFPLDKSDFVRTRLTHSLEVSTIARQLGIMITEKEDGKESALTEAMKDEEISNKIPSALSCAGLLHDIGNPPFGHFGEVVIGEWYEKEFGRSEFQYKGTAVAQLLNDRMKNDLSNFEGNAQALRILSKIKNKEVSHEINLTSGVISALIKYPTDSVSFTDHRDSDIRKHKLGYYLAEEQSFMKISHETGTWLGNGNVARHPLAFLMEAADDIAYSTADLEDALKKRLFTLEEFIAFFEREMGRIADSQMQNKSQKLLEDLRKRMEKGEKTVEGKMIAFQNWMEFARGWFMYCVAYSFDTHYEQIMAGEYGRELLEGTFHEKSMKIFKDAMKEFVYGDPEIVKLELAAKKIIFSLLDDFAHAVIYWEAEEKGKYELSKADRKLCGLIPDNFKEDYKKAKTGDEAYDLYLRFMMVNDFISGMTDSYAKNLYQELNAYK
ncbi:MAG: deoxyguanosinetriphosphate triphosphohydrolase [Lachnospiraceae bacterium]|nr:deoxyguanosinetriphosphate triphosphohydrolase [Lachnospiraceae bacterium]